METENSLNFPSLFQRESSEPAAISLLLIIQLNKLNKPSLSFEPDVYKLLGSFLDNNQRCLPAQTQPSLLSQLSCPSPAWDPLYESAQAAITKYHRWGGFNNRNLFSLSARGWKPEIKVFAGLVSPKASLLLANRCCLLAVASHGRPCAWVHPGALHRL